MSLRCLPQNIEYLAPLKFCTQSVYQTDHPTSAIAEKGYFDGAAHKLATGDEITVCCMRDDGTWDKAVFEMLRVDRGVVQHQQLTPWRYSHVKRTFGEMNAPAIVTVTGEKTLDGQDDPEDDAPDLIPAKGEDEVFSAEHKHFGKWIVRNQRNEVVADDVDKATAQSYLARNPVTEAA